MNSAAINIPAQICGEYIHVFCWNVIAGFQGEYIFTFREYCQTSSQSDAMCHLHANQQ
jgi:hypothetical protein